jgi:hypothetical protein
MELCREYPVAAVCRSLGVARSSLYYRKRRDNDTPLKTMLVTLAGRWPTYGYRRLRVELRRAGMHVNGKRVRRLMRELGLVQHSATGRVRTTNSVHALPRYPNLIRDLAVSRPDQVWVADITYISLRSECVYLAIIMDVFTRAVRGWHLGHTLDAGMTIAALDMAIGGQTSITPTRASSMPIRGIFRCSRMFRSVWRRLANQPKMDTPNGSSGPSRKKKWHCQITTAITTHVGISDGSSPMYIETNASTRRSGISHPLSSNAHGRNKTTNAYPTTTTKNVSKSKGAVHG